METAQVSGRFIDKTTGKPVDGMVEFFPSRFWITEYGTDYATLAPRVYTENGRFHVELTPTHKRDNDFGFHYTVKCPVGSWTIKVEAGEHLLKNLLPTRYAK